jgi:hypothetical protein
MLDTKTGYCSGQARQIGGADPVLPIGGFFGLSIDEIASAPDSVWNAWTEDFATAATFGTGRAALAALINLTAPQRIWLPAYLCGSVTDAVETAASKIAAEIQTYSLTCELEPEVRYLGARLAPGDMVLVVDYFGWQPSQTFRDWARERSDVVWVEDRAQALWTGGPPWAPWSIFSPRKLLGVPNGGILLGSTFVGLTTVADNPPDLTVAVPELMRFEDRCESQNERWYGAYQKRERSFTTGSGPMSRLTEALLRCISIAPLLSARQDNYEYLLNRLRGLAAWPRSAENVAPFGLVIAVEDAQSLAQKLAAERLFCARHWPDIRSDPTRFPYEHELSRQLLTLPCDHRYTILQLARLADAIERLAPRPGCIRNLL